MLAVTLYNILGWVGEEEEVCALDVFLRSIVF